MVCINSLCNTCTRAEEKRTAVDDDDNDKRRIISRKDIKSFAKIKFCGNSLKLFFS